MSSTIKEIAKNSAKTVDLARATAKLQKIRETGLHPGYSTGWPVFDQFYKFPPFGQLNVITGSPSSGKSEFIDALAMNMALNYDWKIFYYSPEKYPTEYHIQTLAEKYCGKPMFSDYTGYEKITDEEYQAFSEFLRAHYDFVDCEHETTDVEKILNSLLLQGHKDMVIIDPWNKMNCLRERDEKKTDFIGRWLTKISIFCRLKNISFWIIAHPAKPEKNSKGDFNRITLYDVEDSRHWFNMIDNGFVLHRSWDDKAKNTMKVHCRIEKVKDRRYARFGEMDFIFEPASGRYHEANPGSEAENDRNGKLAF